MAKGTINKLKTTMDWEKILQIMQLTRAEFIKCTNSSYTNNKQTNTTIKKWAEYLNRHFFKEDRWPIGS